MQNAPRVEWQRLTETYSKMYDDELLNLAADSADLTEQARQVLAGGMQKRGLQAPRAQHEHYPAPRLHGRPLRLALSHVCRNSLQTGRRPARSSTDLMTTHGRRRYASARRKKEQCSSQRS